MARVRPLYPLVILAITFVAYAGTFTAPFLFDDAQLVNGASVHTLSWATVRGTTRPVVQLSLALNWTAGGGNPFGFHVVNFTIHVLAALALFGLVRRTLALPRFPARWRDAAPELALAASLVFAVHPLQTESVSYVIQRAESLMGLLYLATLYAVVRGATAAATARAAWYAAAVVACALGMLTKPVMVTAPVIALLYDRVFLAGSWRRAWHERAALHGCLFATWLLLALLLGSGAHESASTAGFAMRDVGLGEFVRSQPGVVLRYLRLVVWPYGLVLDYGWPIAETVGAIVVPALVLAALLAAAFWAVRGSLELRFLVIAFLVILAPSSSVVPIRDLAFEHRMYLPMAALATLGVCGGWVLVSRARLTPAGERRHALAAAAMIVTALTLFTIVRNRDYASPIVMWSDVTTKRPENPRGWANLAQALMIEHRADEAIAAARRALALDPNFADAHVHLGHALGDKREWRAAEAQYAEAVRVNPRSAEAQNNWGALLADQKRYAEAEPHYVEALRLLPDYAEAKNNLGVAVMQRGDYAQAAALFEEAIGMSPTYAEPFSNLGNLLMRQGRAADAVDRYVHALGLKPEYAEVHFNLALALSQLGRREEAAAHVRDALRLRPDLAPLVQQAGLLPAR
jgi:tetratricopeptide (TPR) repeat protein